jgi:hypothetical protein
MLRIEGSGKKGQSGPVQTLDPEVPVKVQMACIRIKNPLQLQIFLSVSGKIKEKTIPEILKMQLFKRFDQN